ncbi:MAG: cell division protein ZapA [Chitinophagaceae bacterium]|jgi:cell division protein ZapA|nr:cell division protein ZapA [Chitinophagaceae bacterium]OQY95883.1 MAG: cell division protein ZapA [Sphingobacteriales bacterium UTBCD1]
MESLIAATVVIGDRSYRIKIRPEDEEVVRKTIKTINDKILEFRTQFAGKDMQDYIAMVLAWYATEQNSAVAAEVEKINLEDQLNSIEKILDNQLKANS